jgi:hypothetical protein
MQIKSAGMRKRQNRDDPGRVRPPNPAADHADHADRELLKLADGRWAKFQREQSSLDWDDLRQQLLAQAASLAGRAPGRR